MASQSLPCFVATCGSAGLYKLDAADVERQCAFYHFQVSEGKMSQTVGESHVQKVCARAEGAGGSRMISRTHFSMRAP